MNIEVVNQAPLTVPDIYAVRGLLFFGPTENDTDSDGDNLMPPTVLTPQQHGELVALPNSSYRYTPNQGFSGTDTFTYRVCDSLGACSSTTVTLYVIGSGENDGTCSCHARIGSPVNVTNGNMYLQQGDYALPGVGPGISVTRTYNSNSQTISLFGRGWSSDYDESIIAYDNNLARINQADGRAIYLGRPVGSGATFAPIEADFHGSLGQNGGSSTLTMIDGSVHQFSANGKLISLTDRVGNQTTVTYDGAGKLASVTDPFGRVLSFTTNSNGQVLSLSDTMGTVATYTYDGSNRLLSVTYADNSAFHFSYDGNNRLTTVTDALGNIVESHTYDGQGRALTSERQGGVEHYALNYVNGTETDVTDALGHVTKYNFDKSAGRNVVTRVEGLCSCGGSQVQTWTYDGQLNVTAKTDALNHVTNYTYDTAGNRLTETDATGTVTQTFNSFAQVLTRTNQMNGVATNTYDAQGNLLTSKDALNNTSTFTYNSHGQPLTVTDARGKITTFIYDSNGRMTQHKDALNHETTFAYDDRARPTSVTNALNEITNYEYDAAGRLKKTTFPDAHFVSLTYDLAGRRTKITDARGNETNYAYDGSNRLTAVTDALSHSMSYAYNSMSNLTSTTDALSRVTNYNYDDFNRLIKTTYPAATTGATRLFDSLSYDAAGNVTSKTDTAGRVTSYSYDGINRLTGTTDAAAETTSFQYDALSRVTAVTDALAQEYQFAYDALGRQTEMTRAQVTMIYEYDAVGNRIARTDYNGVQTNYTYDDLNRLTAIAYPDSTGATYAYDALSRLSVATNENGTVSFTYDNRGRISATTDVWGQTISYGYDAGGNRTAMTLNGDVYANYAYDANNRLIELTDSNALAVNYNYDATNKLSARGLPNGVNTSYTYDGLGRLTHLLDAKSSTTILDNQLSYNTASQITGIADAGGTHEYGYDDVDRLLSAAYPGAEDESYEYDAVGNRTSSAVYGAHAYEPFNRLVSAGRTSFSYDNNGNQIAGPYPLGSAEYVYDLENRLTEVTDSWRGALFQWHSLTVDYSYDALGRRIKRSKTQTNGIYFSNPEVTKYVYDGQDVVLDLNDEEMPVEYLNGPGIDNKLRQANGQTNYYFTSDHLGSTRALTNDDGEVVEEIAYDSFGNSTGSALTRYTYTGREFDRDTHLYYYRARFYDPHIGRFISEDPIRFHGGINWYDYGANDPINSIDPLGWAKFFFWQAHGASKFGHVSLLLDDGTYISYWPGCRFPKDALPYLNDCPARAADYDKDVAGEAGMKPLKIQIDDLDEAAIKRWWNDGKGHGDFGDLNNCSDIVSEALRVGGLPVRRTTLATTPSDVKEEIERLLQQRLYPPPIPQPPPTPTPCPGKCR
ncbi:MAG TPA: hypothetical protein DC047_15985 [Blastocatellia bacterium]|nr:hypothetical protein [Blastocatellia bacterium]